MKAAAVATVISALAALVIECAGATAPPTPTARPEKMTRRGITNAYRLKASKEHPPAMIPPGSHIRQTWPLLAMSAVSAILGIALAMTTSEAFTLAAAVILGAVPSGVTAFILAGMRERKQDSAPPANNSHPPP